VEHIASIYETCQNVQNYLVLGFGELPPRNALLLQCSEVTVDFIGPWKITATASFQENSGLVCHVKRHDGFPTDNRAAII